MKKRALAGKKKSKLSSSKNQTRTKTKTGKKLPVNSAVMACDVCGTDVDDVHCKLQCPVCGATRDCSDP